MVRSVRLIRSPLSIAGMVLTTISAVVFLVVFLADLFGMHTNPYIGILFFLILPGIFVFGLILIPLGAWIERRRRAAGKKPSELHWPRIDLNNAGPPPRRRRHLRADPREHRHRVAGGVSGRRVHGLGPVLRPGLPQRDEARSDRASGRPACARHLRRSATSAPARPGSPSRSCRARASCWPSAFHTYSRPIPSPVQNLRPARDTCEQCHWPAKFHGDKVRRIVEYGDDEKNTESVTTLQMHVGGGTERRREPPPGSTGTRTWRTRSTTSRPTTSAR